MGKFSPGEVIESGYPNDCPLDHHTWIYHEMPQRLYRVVSSFTDIDGHDCLKLEGVTDCVYCSGTFRKVEPSTEDIFKMAKEPVEKEMVHG